MDKKKIIAIAAALGLAALSAVLKEDVKALVCDAPAPVVLQAK